MSIEPEAVTAETVAGQFAYERLHVQFEAVVALGDRLKSNAEVETVHDMRVAIRRFRAILKLFQTELSQALTDLDKRFAKAGSRMGAVRDMDVQIERLEKWSEDVLLPRLRGDREIAAEAMQHYLVSFAYRQLIVTTKALLTQKKAKGGRTLGEVLPEALRKRHRKFARKAEKLEAEDPAKRFHEARIAAKKLRYTVEVAGEVFETAKPYAKQLAKVQDVLGEHQDCFVACQFFSSESSTWSLAEQEAARELAWRYEERALKLRAKFPSVFEKSEVRGWEALEGELGA